MRRIAVPFIIMVAFLGVAATAAGAIAYPAGWTVQDTIPAGSTVDGSFFTIRRSGGVFHAAWTVDNTLYYSYTTNKHQWSTPQVIEDGTTSTARPLLIGGTSTGGRNNLWLIYSQQVRPHHENRGTRIRKTNDRGTTWEHIADFVDVEDDWTTGPRRSHRQHKGCWGVGNSIQYVYLERAADGRDKITVRGMGFVNGRPLLGPLTIGKDDRYTYFSPDVASDTSTANDRYPYVVYSRRLGSTGFWELGYSRYKVLSGGLADLKAPVVLKSEAGANYRHPSISWDVESTGGPLIAATRDTDKGEYATMRWKYYENKFEEWPIKDLAASIRPAYPEIWGKYFNNDTWAIRSDGSVSHIHNAYTPRTGWLDTITDNWFLDVPAAGIRCHSHNRASTEFVAAVSTSQPGIFIRWRDELAPRELNIRSPQTSREHPLYFNGNFNVTSTAVDDIAITAVDVATGDHIVNGIRDVRYRYSTDGKEWKELPVTDYPQPVRPPYRVEADVSGRNGLGDKRFRLQMIATDSAGNEGTYSAEGWIITITTPPREPAFSAAGTRGKEGWYVSNPRVSITSDSSHVERIEYRLNGSENWIEYTRPLVLPDGIHSAEARVVDRAGNIGRIARATYKVDTTPPDVSILRPRSEVIKIGFTPDQQQLVESWSHDINGIDHASLLIDGKEVRKYNSGFDNMTYTWHNGRLEEGQYQLEVVAYDRAGNVGRSSRNVFLGNFSKDWYFAEGNTSPEFDQYFCVQNPGNGDARLQFTFMTDTGEVINRSEMVASRTRSTFALKSMIPVGYAGVSTHIHCDNQAIIVERPIYFNYREGVEGRNWKGGHTALGINVLQKEFYFAEGTTRQNSSDGLFDHWITIQNPQDEPAEVRVTYMLGTGENIEKNYRVTPRSRHTIDVNMDIGVNQDVSTKLSSNQLIAAERPMYFDYHQYAREGSNIVGVCAPSRTWYFAEGNTYATFQQWITIQNPNDVVAEVDLSFYTGDGKSTTGTRQIKPRSRDTLNVLDYVGDNQDVSTSIASSVPVIAERPMYFLYHQEWDGGHVAMGARDLSTMFYLAEGNTRSGFDTFYTFGNPGDEPARVKATFMISGAGTVTREYLVGPASRRTVNLKEELGEGLDVSCYLESDEPIMVERPMYFNYNNSRCGGSISPGYPVD